MTFIWAEWIIRDDIRQTGLLSAVCSATCQWSRNGKPKCSYESQMCAERGSDEECKIVIITAKGLRRWSKSSRTESLICLQSTPDVVGIQRTRSPLCARTHTRMHWLQYHIITAAAMTRQQLLADGDIFHPLIYSWFDLESDKLKNETFPRPTG